jgi:hypothetical protein
MPVLGLAVFEHIQKTLCLLKAYLFVACIKHHYRLNYSNQNGSLILIPSE